MRIPIKMCQTVWPHPGNHEHLHVCLRGETHAGRHLCHCGDRLDPDTVIALADLDLGIRAACRARIAAMLDDLKPESR